MIAESRARIVVAGGGFAGLLVLLGLADLPHESIALELISPQSRIRCCAPSGEAGEAAQVVEFDLATVAESVGVNWTEDSVDRVDLARSAAHTAAGRIIEYDSLALTTGTRVSSDIPDALCVGRGDRRLCRQLIERVAAGEISDLAFVVPAGTVWPLALYCVAVEVARASAEQGLTVNLTLVTAEVAPLGMFGVRASEEVAALLRRRGITLLAATRTSGFADGVLSLVTDKQVAANEVVAVPRLRGPGIAGLPCDSSGFLRVDGNGLVEETTNVYAAGDDTSFPVKRQSIAALQADAVAAAVAAAHDSQRRPRPYRPVMRGLSVSPDVRPYFVEKVAGLRRSTDALAGSRLLEQGAISVHYLADRLREVGVEPLPST